MSFSPVLLAIPVILAIMLAWRVVQRHRAAYRAQSLPRDDTEMTAAMARARASVGRFWQHFADPRPGETDFMLRISISNGDLVEHLWCDRIEGDQVAASAVVGNEPLDVATVRRNQRISFGSEQISDWAFRRDGRIVGGETLRAMQQRFPPGHPARREIFID
ncbi:DUF2314 domain-containing protein [Devosia sp. CN2-171]|uniref:DUF2314 domain-containing protein n=1 Tax=Devosia sp. CN2-171 TaxID=3400909 RepID=UPI003BF86379